VSELAYDDALAEAPRAIADATTGIARISRIVQSVRSHAHLRDRAGLVPVDVNEQVRAALDLARSEYQDEADVVVDLADVPRVLGDPGDLCLAMVSLLTNAAYAMRDRRHDSGERGLLTVSTRAEGASVEIEIRDTGTGIAREIRERVFEPFFTTKPIGQGTGQGLPIARATIVERHRGTLRFDTEVGRGTAFVIGLPVLGDGTEAIEDPVAPVARGPG
jgi:signal transduction histidine kinase